MKYAKPPLTFEQQADQLIQRGLIADRGLLIERLSSVNYYRLSGYWFHRRLPDDSFKPGTTFAAVWDQYVFDRRLRLLVMDAVERIEIALRTKLSYEQAHAHGAFGYAQDVAALPNLASSQRAELLKHVSEEVSRSREQFVGHFFNKYGDVETDLPTWMATEVMSFGSVLKLLAGSSNQLQDAVAKPFGVSHQVLRSWLWTLNEARNSCAHHGRLWNKELGNKPLIPLGASLFAGGLHCTASSEALSTIWKEGPFDHVLPGADPSIHVSNSLPDLCRQTSSGVASCYIGWSGAPLNNRRSARSAAGLCLASMVPPSPTN